VLVRELSAEETLDVLHSRQLRLERHHSVVIAEDAIRAAVDLTDRHQLDRHRPDRAIDALDEACAHAHAVARYSPETERLIAQRRAAMADGGTEPRDAAQRAETADEALERLARNGVSALQRFGAELEAMLGGASRGAAGAAEKEVPGTPETAADQGTSEAPPNVDSLDSIDAALRERLMQDGVIVRGIDVARVVALGSGKFVAWTTDSRSE
ncbi:MAG: hypothetical protein ACT4R6_08740, partial [Gemmatimonadaceae bacterium]